MARSIDEIKRGMTDDFMGMDVVRRVYGLDGRRGFEECFGKVSLEGVLFYVFAAAVWALEKLFDLHRDEVAGLIEGLEPHTLRWYVNKAKGFMWSQDGSVRLRLAKDGDYYDPECLAHLSEEKMEELRVVKYAVATESNTVVYLKVARADSVTGNPTPLSGGMLAGLRTYMEEVKDAGVSVVVRNEPADEMRISLLIYYNASLLTVDENGAGMATDGSEPVRDAVRGVIENLPFDGVFRKSDLMAAVQGLACVEVADVRSVEVKRHNGTEWRVVEGFDRPYSGYYGISGLEVEYKPYMSGE